MSERHHKLSKNTREFDQNGKEFIFCIKSVKSCVVFDSWCNGIFVVHYLRYGIFSTPYRERAVWLASWRSRINPELRHMTLIWFNFGTLKWQKRLPLSSIVNISHACLKGNHFNLIILGQNRLAVFNATRMN